MSRAISPRAGIFLYSRMNGFFVRIVSGLLALLLGIAALISGIGLQTFWAPPETKTASVAQPPAEAPLTLITGDFAQVDDDEVDYTLTGEGEYTVMLGRERDVRAWIGDAAYNEVTGIQADVAKDEDPQVTIEHTEGEATVPNPAGSDLWIETFEVAGTLEQRWNLPEEDRTALLIAVDGTEPAPTEMTVTWTNREGTSPWITPLIVIGSVLIVLGLALLIWAAIRRRRDGGSGGSADPAASQPAPGTRAAARAAAAAEKGRRRRTAASSLVAGALVTGLVAPAATAAPSQEAGATDEATSEAADASDEEFLPVLVEQQLERIVGTIVGVVGRADRAQDEEQLNYRVGPIVNEMRTMNYRNRGYDNSVGAVEPLAASPVLAAAVTEDPSFPRTVVVVTEGENNETPQLMVLEQASARQQYQLQYALPMTPGAELPGAGLDQPGAALLELTESEGLMVSPEEAMDTVVATLTDADHNGADQVADNPYIDAIQEYQEELTSSAADANIRLNRRVLPQESTAVRLPDGSALVFAAIDANVNASPQEAGGTVIASDLARQIAEEDSRESQQAIFMRYRELVALHVPSDEAQGDDATISLVGFQDELYDVSYAQ